MKTDPFTQKLMRKWTPFTVYPLIVIGLLATTPCHAAERDAYKNKGITFSISVRTPEQIRAFYSARGFPEMAIKELESKCLLSVVVLNGRNDIVWLAPSKWRFVTNKGINVRRLSREEWDDTWAKLNIPLASRATFGWTQLPESRDLLAGETAGGNIVIMPPKEPFSADVLFETGADKHGPTIRFKAKNLQCVQPSPSGDKE